MGSCFRVERAQSYHLSSSKNSSRQSKTKWSSGNIDQDGRKMLWITQQLPVSYSKPLEMDVENALRSIMLYCLIDFFHLLLFLNEKQGMREEEIFPISSSRGCCSKMIIPSCYSADNHQAAQEEQSILIMELKNIALPKASPYLGWFTLIQDQLAFSCIMLSMEDNRGGKIQCNFYFPCA